MKNLTKVMLIVVLGITLTSCMSVVVNVFLGLIAFIIIATLALAVIGLIINAIKAIIS